MKKNHLLAAALLLIGLLVFYSCQKTESARQKEKIASLPSFTNPEYPMNIRLAQRYYDKLKREQGNVVNSTVKARGGEANIKSLVWKKAIEGQTSTYTFVEVPVFYNRRPSFLVSPNGQKYTIEESKKLINASFDRLLITKNKVTGKVNQYIVTYLPDLEYLKRNNNDASANSYSKLAKDFSGFINYSTWNGEGISMYRVENGKFVGKIYVNYDGKQTASNKVQSKLVCTEYQQYCVTEWEQNCGYSGEGAWNNCGEWYIVWQICDQPYCSNWEDDGTPEDPGDGGSGEDPPPPPPDPCTDVQPAANATTILSQNSSYTSAKSSIQGTNPNVEHSVTFGTDVNGNTTASSVTSCTSPSTCTVNTNWPGAFADLHNHSNDLPPSPGDMYNLIGVNNNHSGYNTRMVVTPDGSVYALVILDLAVANAFKTAFPPVNIGYGPDFPSDIYVKFDEVKDQFMLQGLSPIIAEERAMSYVLDKYNTGIALLKQDSIGNFKRLKTDENTSNGNTIYTANNCQ